jgi:hypothetical protein
MPVNEFIISVFCWVEQGIADVARPMVKLRQRGHQPRLSDAEVITMELVGEFLGYEGDKAVWSYFRRHWRAWFPALGDRTTFDDGHVASRSNLKSCTSGGTIKCCLLGGSIFCYLP